MASNDLQRVGGKFQALATDLSGPGLRRVGVVVGMAAKDDATKFVRRDAGGDTALSGWREKTNRIGARFDIKGDTVTIVPEPRSRGPMRVLNDGRHQGNASGIAGPGVVQKGANRGLTLRTKSGNVRKVRARQGSKWNGRTRGKGTWDDAMAVTIRETPQRALDALMEESVDKLFKG